MAQSKSTKFARLSYTISPDTAIGSKTFSPLEIEPIERLAQGDQANSSFVKLFNHCGTHIDMPGHTFTGGKVLSEMEIDRFFFDRPLMLDIPLKDSELVSTSQLARHENELNDCDLLLIRSGFSRFRDLDRERYRANTPGISGDAANYLVSNFRNIRCLGVDFLSIEWIDDMSHGFAAHNTFFSHDVMAIEDLNLADVYAQRINRVYAFPLIIDGVDSFHATVIAEIDEV